MARPLFRVTLAPLTKTLGSSSEAIIHVGSNDITRNVPVENIVDNIDADTKTTYRQRQHTKDQFNLSKAPW